MAVLLITPFSILDLLEMADGLACVGRWHSLDSQWTFSIDMEPTKHTAGAKSHTLLLEMLRENGSVARREQFFLLLFLLFLLLQRSVYRYTLFSLFFSLLQHC